MNSQEVVLRLGESGPSLGGRYPNLVKVVKQPAGIDFYKIKWYERPRGIVVLDHGRYSVRLEDVLSVSAGQDSEEPGKSEGLSEYSIGVGLSVPSPGLLSHDEAKQRIYEIVSRLLSQGWELIYQRDDPRLMGRDRLAKVAAGDFSFGLDVLYVPSLDEWMQVPTRSFWMLHADGVFLKVSFQRERTLLDPTELGAYVLSFDFETAAVYFRGYVKSEDRERWKELLPPILARLAAERARREAELKSKGVKIDESYRDPLPPL